MAHEQLNLPALVASPSDLRLLARELRSLNEVMFQAKLAKQSQHNFKLPKVSRFMDQFSSLNKLNLLHEADRHRASEFLEWRLIHFLNIHLNWRW